MPTLCSVAPKEEAHSACCARCCALTLCCARCVPQPFPWPAVTQDLGAAASGIFFTFLIVRGPGTEVLWCQGS